MIPKTEVYDVGKVLGSQEEKNTRNVMGSNLCAFLPAHAIYSSTLHSMLPLDANKTFFNVQTFSQKINELYKAWTTNTMSAQQTGFYAYADNVYYFGQDTYYSLDVKKSEQATIIQDVMSLNAMAKAIVTNSNNNPDADTIEFKNAVQ